jgi:hypothetical protein
MQIKETYRQTIPENVHKVISVYIRPHDFRIKDGQYKKTKYIKNAS